MTLSPCMDRRSGADSREERYEDRRRTRRVDPASIAIWQPLSCKKSFVLYVRLTVIGPMRTDAVPNSGLSTLAKAWNPLDRRWAWVLVRRPIVDSRRDRERKLCPDRSDNKQSEAPSCEIDDVPIPPKVETRVGDGSGRDRRRC
jgi:hypothetical protein